METGKPKGMPGVKKGGKQRSGRSDEDEPKQVRKQREFTFARKRSPKPTVRVEHAVQVCPECETQLSHGSVWRRREVIEIAPNPAI